MTESPSASEDAPIVSRSRLFASVAIVVSIAALLLVAAGTHIGARNPDAWYTVTARFVGGLFQPQPAGTAPEHAQR